MRQIELARAVFKSRTPIFGSCWAFRSARWLRVVRSALTPLGAKSALRGGSFARTPERAIPCSQDGPRLGTRLAIHLDLVTGLPEDATVLASNSLTPVQAAEIRHEGGVMWCVQYHPEYSLAETLGHFRQEGRMTDRQGFFRSRGGPRRLCRRPRRAAQRAHPAGSRVEVRLGRAGARRSGEADGIANFIAEKVRPESQGEDAANILAVRVKSDSSNSQLINTDCMTKF